MSRIFLLFLNFKIIYLSNSDTVSKELLLDILFGCGFFLVGGGVNSVNMMCLFI